ncbi:hypothetical protein [Leptospira andrefontaineae]|uniref:Uncharacterized protein n=1 Tax=Leptospira andrefontaineae TaxID=2484976 RepID=A0A4R9GYS5_9LEPT|nr:hypothetical protein [Leptospira andrefontaineae]TGK36270.1 hypothetical protein EHO65_18390 [Leptospira andrefontaineae]
MTPEAQAARDEIIIWVLTSVAGMLGATVAFFLIHLFNKLNRISAIAYAAKEKAGLLEERIETQKQRQDELSKALKEIQEAITALKDDLKDSIHELDTSVKRLADKIPGAINGGTGHPT